MNIIKYIYLTPWAQIRKDIVQYRQICRQCELLCYECNMAYNDLILIRFVALSENIKNSPFACVLHVCWVGGQSASVADDGCWHNTAFVDVKKCPDFTDGDSIVRCPNRDCVCYKQNQKFYEAKVKYNAQVKLRDEFWRGVFARSKK